MSTESVRPSGKAVHEDFSTDDALYWKRYIVGNAALEHTGSSLLFDNAAAHTRKYTNAQIDDYQRLPRRRFPWRPPLKLTVRARFSHPAGELRGTAGFGFWNDPFLMTGARVPMLPRALWFFYASSPSDMKLDMNTPGYGWKVATIDVLCPAAPPLALLAPLAVPLMNLPPLYRLLWPPIQQVFRVSEAPVATDMIEWHTYLIEWGVRGTRFIVDGDLVLDTPATPRGPLGFVAWLDNQYLVVTPWGRLKWGLLDVPGRQWMEVDWFEIEPLTDANDL